MISSKSPRTVAAVALEAGKQVFSDYSHVYSPHKFTQPQLFACLVLKDFEKKDYRGVCQLLEDCADLRDAIGLKTIPHFTTLQKASARLLKRKHVRRLVDDTVARIRKRSKTVKYAAADSSGFDAHHASRYFILRTKAYKKGKEPKKRTSYKHYGKLMLTVCTATHAILAAVASRGPTPDVAELDRVLMELAPSQKLKHLVADAGFDSAHNHTLLREYPSNSAADRYRRSPSNERDERAGRGDCASARPDPPSSTVRRLRLFIRELLTVEVPSLVR